MGFRLSAIATRTGDGGSTKLGNGQGVSKSDARVAAMGDVDELNSAVGMLIAFDASRALEDSSFLSHVQQDLLDLGGELSIPGYTLLKAERLAALDSCLAQLNGRLPRLEEFVLPGGSVIAAQAHMCRTICRRAERAVVLLAETQAVSTVAGPYLNRLSDLMFVLARTLNMQQGDVEPLWDRSRNE